jgi:hypothetical protein
MAEHLKPYQFQKGMEKIGGRQKGTRNKISEAFLKDLHAEWERSGQATLRILAVEQPAAFAHLVAKILPQAFDDEFPAVIRIVTGVPRAGEDYQPPGSPRSPTISPAFPDQLPKPVREGADSQ